MGGRLDRHRVIGDAAPLQLLYLSVIAGAALGLILTSTGQSGTNIELHLAVLLASGTAVVLLALRPSKRSRIAPRKEPTRADEPSRLLAQMQHELRTPLNAVIGFSEAMQHELHGPLGNSRYQEYAAHINASGGRLLKASEDAIAVATSMSALLADRRILRRDRLPLAALLQEAWEALGTPATCGVRLAMHDTAAVEIDCDWQATSQVLRHLLAEAAARTAPDGTIAVHCSHAVGARRIEIVAETSRQATQHSVPPAGGCLRLILVRSLLEMQGATLTVAASGERESWSATIAFPVAPALRRQRRPLHHSRPQAHRIRETGIALVR